jgi:biopolymer transport protein ExbD
MIRIRGSKDYLIALESVAMTDIVMNMFIFFFISFSLLYTFDQTRMSKIEVKLPKASSAMSLDTSDKTILAITSSGEYFINDEKIRKENLKSSLEHRSKADPDLGIVLKVDSAARFDAVVKALDIINELGIQRVSIASVKKE